MSLRARCCSRESRGLVAFARLVVVRPFRLVCAQGAEIRVGEGAVEDAAGRQEMMLAVARHSAAVQRGGVEPVVDNRSPSLRWRTEVGASLSEATARQTSDGDQARKQQRVGARLGNDGDDRNADIDCNGQEIEV